MAGMIETALKDNLMPNNSWKSQWGWRAGFGWFVLACPQLYLILYISDYICFNTDLEQEIYDPVTPNGGVVQCQRSLFAASRDQTHYIWYSIGCVWETDWIVFLIWDHDHILTSIITDHPHKVPLLVVLLVPGGIWVQSKRMRRFPSPLSQLYILLLLNPCLIPCPCLCSHSCPCSCLPSFLFFFQMYQLPCLHCILGVASLYQY